MFPKGVDMSGGVIFFFLVYLKHCSSTWQTLMWMDQKMVTAIGLLVPQAQGAVSVLLLM